MKLDPAHRRLATIAVSAIILIVFVVVGSTARVSFVGIAPGPTVNTLGDVDGKPMVSVTDAVDPEPRGHLNLTTVAVADQLTLFESITMWVSGKYEIAPRELYYPKDKSDDEVHQENTQQMASSEDNATGAALNFLGRPTAAGVGSISKGSPAEGKLEVDDVIVAVDGQRITEASKLPELVQAHRPGDVVPFTINRKGAEQTFDVTLAERPDDPEKGFLGVSAKVVSADPNVRIDYNVVDSNGGEIGGPSAGLMLTLSVIDRLTPGDLTKGEFVAGTGTINPDGEVGPIGGITHKLKAARDAGANVFLVPADNCTEAKTKAPDGLELVKVGKLSDAVDALDTLGTDVSRPHCG